MENAGVETMSQNFNPEQFEGNKQFNFGRLATGFYLIALLGMGFIGFSYSLFPTYTVPILLIISFSISALALAFNTGTVKVSVMPIQQTFIVIGLLGVGVVLGLNIFTNVFTNYGQDVALQSSIILGLPLLTSIAFFGFIGILEEVFWSSTYIVLRFFSGGKNILALWGIIAAGGIVFHQAVARQLFQGTIFNSPEYFLWIGLSWVFYRFILELTGHFGVTMLTHFTWNVGITLINQGVV